MLLNGCTSSKTITVQEFYGEDFLEVCSKHKDEIPVKMSYRESYKVYDDITDQELIKKVFDTIMSIKVGEKSNISIEDADRNYYFEYADGSKIGFMMIKADNDELIYSFSDKCNYVIEDDNGLFNIKIGE